MKLTQKKLKELLDYDPETGVFTNRVSRGWSAVKGEVVGCKVGGGYLTVTIKGRFYVLHRLAFLYMEGYLPEHEVDHLNGNPADNSWKNLRHVSHMCNMQNRGVFKTNVSGFPGVSWDAREEKWDVRGSVNRRQQHLGRYEDLLDAALARLTWEVNTPEWTCNHQSCIVKAITAAWPEFNTRSIG